MGREPTPARGDLVLLVGCYRPALAAARALSAAGRRVIAGIYDDRENVEGSGGVEHSRAVQRTWRHPDPIREPDAFLDALEGEVARLGEPVAVLPVYEAVVTLLSRRRARLPAQATLVAPAAQVIEICIDKERTLETARAAALAVLPWETVQDHAQLVDACRHLGSLAIRPLNPQSRLLGRKAILLDGLDHLLRLLPEWPAGHDRLLVQQRARGPRINLHFLARRGEVLRTLETIALRTDTSDGTGLGVENMTRRRTPALDAALRRLVRRLDYTGAGLAQFLATDDGHDGWFLEINPRLGANLALVQHAGVDIVNGAVDLALGRTVRGPARAERAPGERSNWTLGDLAGLRRERAAGLLSRRRQLAWLRRMLVACLRADVHMGWSWRDPLPAVGVWARAGRLAARGRGAEPHRSPGQPA